MTTFAAKSFDAARYFAFRPTYTQHFFDLTYAYHTSRGGQFEYALDLGCGPGLIASQLTSRFPSVLGVDPGEKMIDVARSQTSLPESRLSYAVGKGEDLPFIPSASLDLITVGQAAHWFDFDTIWTELGRVLKPGGTVAFWGYGEIQLPHSPHLQPLITQFMSTLLWEQPGRSIVEGLLSAVPFPVAPSTPSSSSPTLNLLGSTPWTLPKEPTPPAGLENDNWDPESLVRIKETSEGAPLVISKVLSWHEFDAYLSTASGLHNFAREFGEDASAKLRTDFVEALRKEVEQERGRGDGKVEVEWPAVVVLAGKRKA